LYLIVIEITIQLKHLNWNSKIDVSFDEGQIRFRSDSTNL